MGLGVYGDGTRSVIPYVFLAKKMQFRGKRYALHDIVERSARHHWTLCTTSVHALHGIIECSARHHRMLSKVQKNRLKFVSRQT